MRKMLSRESETISFVKIRQLKLFLFAMCVFVAINGYSSEIRGVWVPDPEYTDVLKSYKNVLDFIQNLDSMNFNSVFIVSYAKNQTIYPSKVLFDNGIYPTLDSTNMLSQYTTSYNKPLKSPTGDPVKDLINEAHKRKIKVFFWYEFGFMADFKLATTENNPLLAKNPRWLGVANDGTPSNYNKQDYYFNAFDTDVQNFLIKLIQEGIKRYPKVDGMQGDDRLPAMCINSGYDDYTALQYKTEKGIEPPQNYKDSAWVRWRLDKLNKFGEALYRSVKQTNKKMMVSFAPNPYPWSKDNLMQDWPQWVSNGICDLLAVQCYRRDSLSYSNTVKQVYQNINPVKRKTQLFAPGILMMVSGKISEAEQVKKQMQINRIFKTNGEIFFYNEALKDERMQKVIKQFYTKKAKFPKH